MTFRQSPPELKNQYADDRALRSYLRRAMPPDVLREVEPELDELGGLAGGELYRAQLADRLNEPRLVQWDAWGERVDRIEVSPLWRSAERVAAERGLVAVAYERRHGRHSRLHQAALAYLFTPATDIYSCPLAMTDGAARTLLSSGNRELAARVVPRLTSRDPEKFWTSGQWMTELAGGSDVSRTETVARLGEDGVWRLYGRKWFTSATNAQVALTLARPEGNPEGSRGLALFLVETRDEAGRLRGIRVERLKDKLGTRKVPTAELTLEGAPAELVCGRDGGVRAIAPMLNTTRLWNGISAASLMRRGLALARDYARRRVAFGTRLAEKPLHADTLSGLQAEAEAAMHLAFQVAELTGREEAGELDEAGARLARLLTPLMKLTTGRAAVAAASETLEAFGGAGYVEDTGLPVLLRDAQVLSIWEGTTNVLSLDALRAIGAGGEPLSELMSEAGRLAAEVRDARLAGAARLSLRSIEHAAAWLKEASAAGRVFVEAGARRFALTLGRAFALALLASHAQWSLDEEGDARASAAARRFARAGVDLIVEADPSDASALMEDS
ncbi:MAG TPA: acyl-CoA dehydrogenase family protein [Pyrinomonadaceae bacterium]|nr:acyl-CoA dehydrogenase family protein [Pyrinomonadaceae bacterium]